MNLKSLQSFVILLWPIFLSFPAFAETETEASPGPPVQAMFEDDHEGGQVAESGSNSQEVPKEREPAEPLTLEERIEQLEEALEEQVEHSEEMKEAVDSLSKKLEESDRKLEKEALEKKAEAKRGKALEEKLSLLDKELDSQRNKPTVEIGGHAALDFGIYNGGWRESGFELREAMIEVGKEFFDRVKIEIAPEYNGYLNEFDVRRAVVDVAIVRHDNPVKTESQEVSDERSGLKFTSWRPDRAFGRDAKRHGMRNDAYFSLIAGKFDLPFGIHSSYDHAYRRYSVTGPLPIERSYRRLNDLGLMLYGTSRWVNYAATLVNGRLDGLGAGLRVGFTPLDWLELAVDYQYEFGDPDERSRYQLILAEAMIAVWRFEILGQYTWEHEKNEFDDLYHYGGHGEIRLIFSPLYGYIRAGGFHRGAIGNEWRLTPGLGWWAWPGHLTVKGEYQYNSEGDESLGILQIVGSF